MLFVPQKPLEQMTPSERESWRAWLLEQGKNPQPIEVDTPNSGSSFRYSTSLGSVVEDTVDGGHYVVSVVDGKIQRVTTLKGYFPSGVADVIFNFEALASKIRVHLGWYSSIAAVTVVLALRGAVEVFTSIVPLLVKLVASFR